MRRSCRAESFGQINTQRCGGWEQWRATLGSDFNAKAGPADIFAMFAAARQSGSDNAYNAEDASV